MENVQRELIYLWFYFDLLFRQIFLYWVIGILAGSILSVFFKQQIHALMQRLQGKRWGIAGLCAASALGILSPLCMYGTIPIVASFARGGMREDWLASFMMSSILLNPQLLLYSLALGYPLALLRLAAAFAGGCVAGLAVRIFFSHRLFYRFTAFEPSVNRDINPNLLCRLLQNIWRNVKVTAPYFLLGILLTALYQRYIPSQWMIRLFGGNRGLGTLMAAALGVPLYTCGGGTIPLIAAWLGEGMSSGSVLAFMIAGPATKLTNLGAVKTVLGMRNFVLYIVFSIALATGLGLITDLVISV